jgi:hypothetical protein
MNYTQLNAAISAYAEDFGSSFVANIPVFVKMAEQRIYNTVQLLTARKTSTVNTVSGTNNVALPSDFLAPCELRITTSGAAQSYLLPRDVGYIRAMYPDGAVTGVPKNYAFNSPSNLLLGPTPDAIYTITLTYFYYPETIVTAGTSWLGDNFDSVLLHGALHEATVFMKEEDNVIAKYKELFETDLALLKQLQEGRITQDDYRSGHIRFPVR